MKSRSGSPTVAVKSASAFRQGAPVRESHHYLDCPSSASRSSAAARQYNRTRLPTLGNRSARASCREAVARLYLMGLLKGSTAIHCLKIAFNRHVPSGWPPHACADARQFFITVLGSLQLETTHSLQVPATGQELARTPCRIRSSPLSSPRASSATNGRPDAHRSGPRRVVIRLERQWPRGSTDCRADRLTSAPGGSRWFSSAPPQQVRS